MSQYRRLALEEFKKRAKDPTEGPLNDVMVPKGAVTEIKEVEGSESRVVEAIISTPAVDRDNDTIAIDGWVLDEFRSNPVVLFGHDAGEPPVAKSLSVWKEGTALKSRFQFTKEEENPFGALVFNMVKQGFLRATSVGFVPEIFQINEERGGSAIDFLQQRLLEFSIVPIPSNPEALISAGLKGIGLLKGWTEKALGGEMGELIIPRHCVETTHKLLNGNATTVTVKNDSDLGDTGVVSAGGGEGDASPPANLVETAPAEPVEVSLPDAVSSLVDAFGQDAVLSQLGVAQPAATETVETTEAESVEAEGSAGDDEEGFFLVDLDEVTELVQDAIQQARAYAAGELF